MAEKQEEELGTRMNIEVPDSVNETLNKLIPKGVTSDVFRELTQLYIEANKKHGREFLIKLLDGKAELIPKPDV